MSKRTEHELQITIGGKVDNSLAKGVKSINNKLDSMSSTMKAVAKAAATAFASIRLKDWIDDSIAASKEFETSMAGVAKVVDGLKDDNGKVTQSYYDMKDSIIDLSKELPMTAENIAAIVEAAGQSNIAKDELLEFTETATKMGIAFDSTAEQAGEWMAAWRTALDLDQTEVTALADQINYLGNTSSENAVKLSEVVTRVGSLSKTAGVSASSVAAIAASMTKVPADVAATGIKNFALALASGESATKRQIKAYNSLGLEAESVAKAMQVDSQGTMIDVLERINKLDKDKQSSTMKNLFGSESLSSIAPLAANLDNLKEQFNKVGDSALYAGSMEKEYISAASTAANADILKDNKVHAMQIQIGDTLSSLSVLAAETTGNIAEAFGNFIEDNAPAINSAVKSISDAFEKFAPNAVYTLKSLADGGKDFLEGFQPVFDLIGDNPSLIPNFIVATGSAMVTYKVSKNIGDIIDNVKKAGSPLKLLSGIITNPWALAIGATAGAIALIATSIASAKKELQKADLESRFGDITLSLEDLDEIAAEIIQNDNLGKLSESMNSATNIKLLKDSIDDVMASLKKYNWKVSIGLKLTEDEQEQYKADIINFISESQNLLLEDQYQLKVNMELFTDNSQTGLNIQTKMNEFYDNNYQTLDDLGEKLQKAVNDAFEDGLLTIDESKVISGYMQQMADLNERIADAKFEAKMVALGTEYTGTGLTPESFQNLQEELGEQVEASKQYYTDALADTLQSYKSAYDSGNLSEKDYNDAVDMAKGKYLDQVGELEARSFNFQYQTIVDAYGDELDKAMPEFEKLLSSSVSESMNNVAQDGMWGKAFPVLYDELLSFDGIDSEKKANLSVLFKNLQPTQESMEQLRESYIKSGKDVPGWLSEGLLNSASLGALTGDVDSISKLIGVQIAESPEQVKMTQAAYNSGTKFDESMITGMEYKIPELRVSARGILVNIKDELENGITADVPVNINFKTPKYVTDLLKPGYDEINKNVLGVEGYATGGIITKPTLATFAEEGPEAAIPLDGSKNAIDLWRMAGQILGVFDKDNQYASSGFPISDEYSKLVNNSSISNVNNNGSFKVEYHINVESGADVKKVQQAITMSQEQFDRMMAVHLKNKARSSMGQGA